MRTVRWLVSEVIAQESRTCADSAHLPRTVRIKARILQLLTMAAVTRRVREIVVLKALGWRSVQFDDEELYVYSDYI